MRDNDKGETKSSVMDDSLTTTGTEFSSDSDTWTMSEPPTIAANVVKIKLPAEKTTCVVSNMNASADNLGDKRYDYASGETISYSDIASVLKENRRDDRHGTTRHWLNLYFSHKYNKKQSASLEEHGIYRKHLYALACLNSDKLMADSLLNLMKESSLVLAHVIDSSGSLNFTLSEDQWKALLCEKSCADLFGNEKVKESIIECYKELGSQSLEGIKSTNCINYPALILSDDQIPDLLTSTSYAEAFGMLSGSNQANLRKALKDRASTSFQYFHEFLANFSLKPDEYDALASQLACHFSQDELASEMDEFLENFPSSPDELASELACNSSENEREAYCLRKIRSDIDSSFMLCQVTPDNMDNFIGYLNSLAPGNRISVLTSQRLRLSCETEGENVNVRIIAHEQFFLEDLSFQNVMDVFKSLYSDGKAIYDQESDQFCVNFNNAEIIKHDINILLEKTWVSFVREYKLILSLCEGASQCSNSQFLLVLLQAPWVDTFRSIYGQCCDKKVWNMEQDKTEYNKDGVLQRQYIHLTEDYIPKRYAGVVGETKDEDFNLRPLSSVRLRELAQTLTLNKDYKNAVKVFLMALEQSSEKRLIMDDLVKLFSNNQIRADVKEFFPTMARRVTIFIESELKKSEIDGNNGEADWIEHLVWMIDLDVQFKKLSTPSFAINKGLVAELKTQTIHFSGLQSPLFAEPRSCLAEVWKKLSSFRKPGSVDWQKDLLFSYRASPGDAEALGLMEMLSKNFYNTPLSHNDKRDRYRHTDEDKLILRAVYLRLLLLLGTNPKEGQSLNSEERLDRAEAIDECFRLVETDNRGEQVSKKAANKVRSFFIEKLRDYKRLKDQYERDSSQEQRESGGEQKSSSVFIDPWGGYSDGLNEALAVIDYHFREYFFCLVELGSSFINVLAEYAAANPGPIADYTRKDVANLYVLAESDPTKFRVLIDDAFSPSQNTDFMLSESRAKTFLRLLYKHKVTDRTVMIVAWVNKEIDRVLTNDAASSDSLEEKFKNILNAFNLFNFRLNLQGVDAVSVSRSGGFLKLIEILEEASDHLFRPQDSTPQSLQYCFKSWIALDTVYENKCLPNYGTIYQQQKIKIMRYTLCCIQKFSRQDRESNNLIVKRIDLVDDAGLQLIDKISARKLIFTRLASRCYFLPKQKVLFNHDEFKEVLRSCFTNVSFCRDGNGPPLLVYSDPVGREIVADLRGDLKNDVENAVAEFRNAVSPATIADEVMNEVIRFVFSEDEQKESYHTLLYKQSLDKLAKQEDVDSPEFLGALVPTKGSGGSHNGETKCQAAGQSHASGLRLGGAIFSRQANAAMNLPSIKQLEKDLYRQLIVARLQICGSKRSELRGIIRFFQQHPPKSMKELESRLQKSKGLFWPWEHGRLYQCICQSLKEVRDCLPLLSDEESEDNHQDETNSAQPSAPPAQPSVPFAPPAQPSAPPAQPAIDAYIVAVVNTSSLTGMASSPPPSTRSSLFPPEGAVVPVQPSAPAAQLTAHTSANQRTVVSAGESKASGNPALFDATGVDGSLPAGIELQKLNCKDKLKQSFKPSA